VELFDIDDGGMIFDTPGFTSFSVSGFSASGFSASGAEIEDLTYFYPEMREYIGHCRFDDCRHLREPGCAVLDALSRGRIAESRYSSYVALTEEASKERERIT
jgi:ribosome biogenesis GTPase